MENKSCNPSMACVMRGVTRITMILFGLALLAVLAWPGLESLGFAAGLHSMLTGEVAAALGGLAVALIVASVLKMHDAYRNCCTRG